MADSYAVLQYGFAAVTQRGPGTHYNFTDLNRVGEAMLYLSGRFQSYGYAAQVSPKTDWTMQDFPTESTMELYLADLRTLREVFAVLSTTPSVPPDMERLTWQEANDIERILVDINTVIEWVFKSFRRSGSFMFRSGQNPLPSAESDLGRTWAELDALGLTWDDIDAVEDWYIIGYGVLK